MRREDKLSDSFEFGKTPFYFLRHGETVQSRDGILQGQTETELTAYGRRTAEAVAPRVGALGLRAIYASPLKRAWRTASVLSTLTGVPVHPLPGLMERDWGVYEGRPKEERPNEPDPPTVETMTHFSRRIIAAMRSIERPTPILIVAHSGVFRILARHAGLPIDNATAVDSAQLLLMDPMAGNGSRWRISEVNG